MVSGMQVVVSGHVAKDPTFQTFPDGTAKTKLRIAYSARWQNRETGEWMDGPTSFVGVECRRGLAENVAICVRKGDPVLVHGRLSIRSYQNPAGEWRQAVDVDADAIGHDLSRGVAQFNRIRRTPGDAAAARNRALAAMSAVAARQAQAGAVAGDREDGTGHDGTGHDGTGHEGTGHEGTGHDGTGHDGTGHDGTQRRDDVVDEAAVAELAEELAEPLAGSLVKEPAEAVPA
jgi:single-strand DNA-binding protein